MTPDLMDIRVRISGQSRAGIGRFSVEGLNTGRNEKAPVLFLPVGCTPCCYPDFLFYFIFLFRNKKSIGTDGLSMNLIKKVINNII